MICLVRMIGQLLDATLELVLHFPEGRGSCIRWVLRASVEHRREPSPTSSDRAPQPGEDGNVTEIAPSSGE
jgi:hypothetical protein